MPDVLDKAVATVPGLVVFCAFAYLMVRMMCAQQKDRDETMMEYLKQRDIMFADVLKTISGACHDVSHASTRALIDNAASNSRNATIMEGVKSVMENCSASQVALKMLKQREGSVDGG